MKVKIYLLLTALILVVSCGGGNSSGEGAAMTPEMAQQMIKLKGFEANEKGFFSAIRVNDVSTVRAFPEAGISPNAKNEKGETALTYAIQNSEIKTVKALAEKADINMRDNLGQSPLHLAYSQNKDELFQFLLDKKADVNVPGSKGKLNNQTVLYLAASRGRADLVQQLLERGADPNIADSDGGVPLTELSIGGNTNVEMIKMLLDKGANPNHQEKNGATALIYMASNSDATADKRQEVIKLLLDKGADKTIKDKQGNTALDWAKKNGNKEILELLK